MKKKKKRRERWLFSNMLRLGVSFCVYEDCGMTIENYDEILTCTDCILRVGTPRGVLCVTGEGFCLDELASGALSLSGCVRRIEYEENT